MAQLQSDTESATAASGPRPNFSTLGRDATAAAVVSLAAISFYLSAASLLFQGPLTPHLPAAIGAAMLGGALLSLMGAWRGSLPLASNGAEPATVPVLAALTAGVSAATPGPALLPTVVMALAITALAVGGTWWLMGRRGWGDLIRYIPYPVVGGFLGSIGWLMLTGGMGVAMAQGYTWTRALAWLGGAADARLLVGLAMGLLIWRTTLRYTQPLTLPALLLGGGLAMHAGLFAAGIDIATAQSRGWLLAPFSQTVPEWPLSPATLAAVHWGAVAQNAGLIAAVVIVAIIGLLLSDTSLEVAWDQRADINRDLRTLGQANLLAAATGGLVGGISISRSVLNRAAGGQGRASGLILGLLCLLALVCGGPVIALVPRPLLGGVLVYLGLGMLKAWVVDSRRRLPRRDHLTVLGMVAATAVAGFLPAVCIGVLACCVDFAVSSAQLPPVRRLIRRSDWPSRVERPAAQSDWLIQQGRRLVIVELQGMLFFGATTRLTEEIEALLNTPAATQAQRLLFDGSHLSGLDISAVQSLARLFKTARSQGVVVELSHFSAEQLHLLRSAGALDDAGPRCHADVDAAVLAWDEALLADAAWADPTLQAGLAQQLGSAASAAELLPLFEPLQLAAGQALFTRGEASDALYLVRSGRLVIVVEEGGREITVRTLLPGAAVGEMGLFRQLPRSATVRAELATEVLRLTQVQLDRLQGDRPALAAALYRLFVLQMASRLEQLTAQAMQLAR